MRAVDRQMSAVVGGIIGGHDYFYYAGCKRAIDEFVKHNNLSLNSKTPDWWVVKP